IVNITAPLNQSLPPAADCACEKKIPPPDRSPRSHSPRSASPCRPQLAVWPPAISPAPPDGPQECCARPTPSPPVAPPPLASSPMQRTRPDPSLAGTTRSAPDNTYPP